MTETPIAVEKLSIEDYIRLYEAEGAFEIIEGERIPMSPIVSGHNYIVKIIFLALVKFEKLTGFGETFFETPFILPDAYDSQWVKGSRIPDIMFISADHLKDFREKTPDWKSKPILLIPDLVVEVISQNDLYSEVEKKVARYQADGVKLIWVVDPQTEAVTVHTQDINHPVKYTAEMSLTGGDVLPNFEITVVEIFK